MPPPCQRQFLSSPSSGRWPDDLTLGHPFPAPFNLWLTKLFHSQVRSQAKGRAFCLLPSQLLAPSSPQPFLPGSVADPRSPAHPPGRHLPARASPATSVVAVFMSLQAPRHPAAHSRPSPGRTCLLEVTGSADSRGPGSHRSGRSWAPHAHPRTPPPPGRGVRRGTQEGLVRLQPPPPSWPPGEARTGKENCAGPPGAPPCRCETPRVRTLIPTSGPEGSCDTQVCWHQRL